VRAVGQDELCRRFMAVPGVGPVVALTFKTTVDDPARFKRSRDIGASAGLTPKRIQSGDSIDYDGHISRQGDGERRRALYEAASGLMTRSKTWWTLKAWGMKLQRSRGHKRAVVAAGRKLAIILHATGNPLRRSVCLAVLETAESAISCLPPSGRRPFERAGLPELPRRPDAEVCPYDADARWSRSLSDHVFGGPCTLTGVVPRRFLRPQTVITRPSSRRGGHV
jgi:hypothetical protein